ncbi:hypothetical protein HAX54_033143 [Datura stramonium]|uniref:Uncharacterized protein n=1 Tax=Datura stramonium TaxID=4076 RepID=A0ABS8VD65_DATST|nr:hypothetical protein [Datura stramonium]
MNYEYLVLLDLSGIEIGRLTSKVCADFIFGKAMFHHFYLLLPPFASKKSLSCFQFIERLLVYSIKFDVSAGSWNSDCTWCYSKRAAAVFCIWKPCMIYS